MGLMPIPSNPKTRRLALLAANALAVLVLSWVLWSDSDSPVEAGGTDGATDGTTGGTTGGAVASVNATDEGDSVASPDLDSGRDPDRDSASGLEPGGRTGAGPALPVAPPETETAYRLPSGAIETHIANAVQEAAKRSKGKVGPQSATVSVCVVDVASGRELLARQADQPMRPASNLKLLTTAAALVLLGGDAHFETRFEAVGTVDGGELAGDLIARAGGDPLYDLESDGAVDRWLDELARDLEDAGVRRVRGRLVLDEGRFESPAPGPAWPSSREYWKEYCALAGGFSANGGCLTAVVRASAVGRIADVSVLPEHHGLRRRGEVRTAAADARLEVAVGASASSVTVRGSVPASVSEWSARFAAPDPVELFGHAVVGGLRARGIGIDEGFVRERDAPAGRVVATLRSPVADTFVPILTHSNNAVADQLFLLLGARLSGEGTRAGGARAVARALDDLGLALDGWKQVGGSGLSRDNRVSARQVCGLLSAVRALSPSEEEPRASGLQSSSERLALAIFEDAMPVAGETGTLAKRMRDTAARGRVHAKTGFINGTSGLSGWLQTESGRELVFSILVAYPTADGLNTYCWKPMQDAICATLVDDVE